MVSAWRFRLSRYEDRKRKDQKAETGHVCTGSSLSVVFLFNYLRMVKWYGAGSSADQKRKGI